MSDKHISEHSQTDWQRLDTMADEDIDFSDSPELSPELLSRAIVQRAESSQQERVAVAIDKDILEWFEAKGEHSQAKINTLLRNYIESHSI